MLDFAFRARDENQLALLESESVLSGFAQFKIFSLVLEKKLSVARENFPR